MTEAGFGGVYIGKEYMCVIRGRAGALGVEALKEGGGPGLGGEEWFYWRRTEWEVICDSDCVCGVLCGMR